MVYTFSQRQALLLLSSTLIHPTLSNYVSSNNHEPHDNNADCNCYVMESGADSNTPEYFQYYRFFDFRNLADGPGQFLNTPPAINDTQDQGQETVWNSDILNSDAWNADWSIQNWNKPATSDFPTRMVNSPANIYLQQNDDSNNPFTWLTLRTSRLDDFQSAGEIESNQHNVKHCSMRMYGRVIGSKGAVAGFFTFFDDNNESDIEILTDDPEDTIRYTNQPALDKEGNEVAAASLEVGELPKWTDWHTHRIDWLPKDSFWYLNDKQVAKNTYSVPRTPSYVVMNMWSDGGEWSGNMTVGDSAEFQIQWIEMAFNTSGPVSGPKGGDGKKLKRGESEHGLWKRNDGCKTVCKIDGVKQVGTPEVVHSGASGMGVSWGLLAVVAVVSVVVGM